MNQEAKRIYAEYLDNGYCIIKDVIEKNVLENAFNEIMSSKKTTVFKDRSNKLRRIEGIYDQGENLKNINSKFLELLHKIFAEEYVIFKDKYNAKPPGGEGFFAHYDGIFNWVDANGYEREGWHYYANKFVNILVAIDAMTEQNGALEVAKEHKRTYEELLKNTKMDGTPDIKPEIEASLKFEKILINPGDIVIFSSRCPHRSSKNLSNKDRRTIYYSYNPKREGMNYIKYFEDKSGSQNKASKSLSGEI